MLRQKVPFAALLATLTVVYFCAGKFGLSLAFFNPSASPVWPASGIALAALLLWGYRLWPAIFLGAFLVNISTQGTIATSLGIATGNTLEALLGAWLMRRFANGPKAFERARDISKFVLLAAMLSTAFGATVGVTSLSLGGFTPWEHYRTIWLTWWLGDMVGDLILAPLLVIWVAQAPPRLLPKGILEAVALLAATFATSSLIFFADLPASLVYLTLLPLLWAAFRFGAHGAITSAFLMTVLVLVDTLNSPGPFPTPNPNLSLLLLQIFVATITVTALVLAAVVSERTRAETALQKAKYELTRANENLETRVRHRTDDLERANSALLQEFAEEKSLEQRLATLLSGPATAAAKDYACRALSVIGTSASVPALAALLSDPALSSQARTALERIPGAAVDRALIAALPQLENRLKAGVINSSISIFTPCPSCMRP